MTSDEFIAGVMEQPKGRRDEFAAGEAIAIAPERGARV
jgi:hypothetical protein